MIGQNCAHLISALRHAMALAFIEAPEVDLSSVSWSEMERLIKAFAEVFTLECSDAPGTLH